MSQTEEQVPESAARALHGILTRLAEHQGQTRTNAVCRALDTKSENLHVAHPAAMAILEEVDREIHSLPMDRINDFRQYSKQWWTALAGYPSWAQAGDYDDLRSSLPPLSMLAHSLVDRHLAVPKPQITVRRMQAVVGSWIEILRSDGPDSEGLPLNVRGEIVGKLIELEWLLEKAPVFGVPVMRANDLVQTVQLGQVQQTRNGEEQTEATRGAWKTLKHYAIVFSGVLIAAAANLAAVDEGITHAENIWGQTEPAAHELWKRIRPAEDLEQIEGPKPPRELPPGRSDAGPENTSTES